MQLSNVGRVKCSSFYLHVFAKIDNLIMMKFIRHAGSGTIQYKAIQGNTVYTKKLKIKNTSHNHTKIKTSVVLRLVKNFLTEFTVQAYQIMSQQLKWRPFVIFRHSVAVAKANCHKRLAYVGCYG